MIRHVVTLDPAALVLGWAFFLTLWAWLILWWIDRCGPRRPPRVG